MKRAHNLDLSTQTLRTQRQLFALCISIAAVLISACQSHTPAAIYRSGNTPVVIASDEQRPLPEQSQYPGASVHTAQGAATAFNTQTPRTTNTTQHSAPTRWLARIHNEFSRARTLVEQELDVDLSRVALVVASNDQINTEVSQEAQQLIHNQFTNTRFAQHLLGQMMRPQANTYAAIYSLKHQSIFVSENALRAFEHDTGTSNDTSALQTLLIHELVHAADDRRYNFAAHRAPSFRASLAHSATFEGHAQYVTRRICRRAGCSRGLTTLDAFMFGHDSMLNAHSGTDAASSVETMGARCIGIRLR